MGQLEMILSKSQGRNLVVIGVSVPYFLDSGKSARLHRIFPTLRKSLRRRFRVESLEFGVQGSGGRRAQRVPNPQAQAGPSSTAYLYLSARKMSLTDRAGAVDKWNTAR